MELQDRISLVEFTKEEKLHLWSLDSNFEKRIFDKLMVDCLNDLMDWKISPEYAKWYRDGLNSRLSLSRKYLLTK